VTITVEDYKNILQADVSWRRHAHVRRSDDLYAR
jgi:hypothetical protein